ncbi:MAG: secondary thiamine-phosphate synthase enzyme YjbQ [bacterium]
MFKQIKVNTKNRVEMIDITSEIKEIVDKSGIDKGIVVLKVPHTTAGITINENADPDVKEDIIGQLQKLIPYKNDYQHLEGNSDAHIKSTLVGTDETIIIKNGHMFLGRWQGIFFCEFDGPRTRKLNIRCMEG